jgi:hypothetical protein
MHVLTRVHAPRDVLFGPPERDYSSLLLSGYSIGFLKSLEWLRTAVVAVAGPR